jgi:hypothetical protein
MGYQSVPTLAPRFSRGYTGYNFRAVPLVTIGYLKTRELVLQMCREFAGKVSPRPQDG